MEGHRGEPRNKPPFPGVMGSGPADADELGRDLRPCPGDHRARRRLVETAGAGEHTGLKFFAVSGQVQRPGVYCVPMGSTARQLLELAGGVADGRSLGAIQPGGASSNFLGPDQLDVPLDFDTLAKAGSMLGSGALVVLAEGTNLLAAATNVLRFFRDESCGKCVPCRVGSSKAYQILACSPTAAARPMPREPGQQSFKLYVQHLTLTDVGESGPVGYRADLVNSEPPGEIHSTGTIGPWNEDDPAGHSRARFLLLRARQFGSV